MEDKKTAFVEEIKDLLKEITNRDLVEGKIFYDSLYGEREIDLFDEEYNIAYEINLASAVDFIYSEEELGDYIDEIMRVIEMDSRIREDLGEDNYRVIWIFKSPSETLFKILSENDFEYAILN